MLVSDRRLFWAEAQRYEHVWHVTRRARKPLWLLRALREGAGWDGGVGAGALCSVVRTLTFALSKIGYHLEKFEKTDEVIRLLF